MCDGQNIINNFYNIFINHLFIIYIKYQINVEREKETSYKKKKSVHFFVYFLYTILGVYNLSCSSVSIGNSLEA